MTRRLAGVAFLALIVIGFAANTPLWASLLGAIGAIALIPIILPTERTGP